MLVVSLRLRTPFLRCSEFFISSQRDRRQLFPLKQKHNETLFREKIAQLEKAKARAKAEFDDLSAECERHNTNATIIEKRGRNFDKVVNEWRLKAEDLQNEITSSQTECRNFSSEYFRVKSANEELMEHLDTVKRENKNLAEEIKDLLDQLGEGGRSMHELDKSRRKLEIEKEELQNGNNIPKRLYILKVIIIYLRINI